MLIVVGAIAAAAVALFAWRLRMLTASGAVAAWIVGAGVFSAGSWQFAAVLFAFFIPSTILSRVGRARKRALIDTGKSGARDAGQVFANGGVAATCAVLAAALGNAPLAAAFAGAFAAASSDTWGTELGTLAKAPPRSILTLRPLPRGLSGGVTPVGTMAEVAGAFIVALPAWALGVGNWWIVGVAGFAGALLDSLLGPRFSSCATALRALARAKPIRTSAVHARSASAACGGWTMMRSTRARHLPGRSWLGACRWRFAKSPRLAVRHTFFQGTE